MSLILNTKKLSGKTLFITGASRGIGKAIALKAAQDGANIVLAAKTAEPHPKLAGTIYSAAKEIEDAGGQALPCIVDVRYEDQIRAAVEKAVQRFGGIDIVINNASAISLTSTLTTDMKRYDLMHNINTRGTFLVSKICLPYLQKSNHAHILNISPPLNMSKHWFSAHVAYTMAKYGMSMCVLGMAEEFKNQNISVNALWPQTGIYTAASDLLIGSESKLFSRKPEIMSDAAYLILSQQPSSVTGQFYIDEDVLRAAGIHDMKPYACVPENHDSIRLDIFVGEGQKSSTDIDNRIVNLSEPKETIESLFNRLRTVINKDLVQQVNSVFIFNVNGKDAGKWFLDLKNGNGQCGRGDPAIAVDAVVSTNSKTLYHFLSGNIKPEMLINSSRSVATMVGDTGRLHRLEKLFSILKSKL